MKNISPLKGTSNLKIRSALMAKVITVFLILLIGLLSYESMNKSNKQQQRITEVTRQLSAYQARLETLVNNNLELTQGLAAYISLNPELDQQEYAQFARLLLANENQIKNMGAAKDLIITHLFPLEENKKVLGVNYRDIPQQRQAAEQALALNKIIVAGPVDLIQGGKGLIARKPIRVAQTGETWGRSFLVTAVLSMILR